ncbi:ROK family transcriptional regulator [Tropicimonas isoalkanivorans]|uniref:Sugar kinase of the NBD/HSP70 family, may contain an N-terminal HTH domain n=1 Tax=Tropicimonas isoalkanivorans TaxID=441112 RepID=A0A1I1N1E7_9RHOB|nr:ROK family transcriptional regulator [Tropicimonas isoalkanivorans]SFC91471.1 Sugar kinase of the NBD/HSP70 family, may contain an N-terminal HTH domain [Tropicimonas isoalkanivorans]
MRNGTGEILRRLRANGPLSRAELARRAAISSAGVTKIIAQLNADGLIREREGLGHAIGRPPVAVSLVAGARRVLAIHLGAGRLQVAFSDLMLGLGPARSFEFDFADPIREIISATADLAAEVLESAGPDRGMVLGVGVGVPGSVDASGRVNTHSILAGWRDVAFADAFEAALGLPVVLEHNATAIAMAEARYGAGRDARSILHLFLGKGIGAGFAQTGAGERCAPVEIGHVVVDPGGPACRCGGRGCLERFFSEQPLRDMVGDQGIPRSALVGAAMRTEAWLGVYEHLLQALSTAVTLLGPERVVLGGDLNTAPDAFLEALRRDLPPRVMPQQRQRLTVERTSLPEPAGVHGAACVALERFFYTTGPAAALRVQRLAAST